MQPSTLRAYSIEQSYRVYQCKNICDCGYKLNHALGDKSGEQSVLCCFVCTGKYVQQLSAHVLFRTKKCYINHCALTQHTGCTNINTCLFSAHRRYEPSVLLNMLKPVYCPHDESVKITFLLIFPYKQKVEQVSCKSAFLLCLYLKGTVPIS